MPSWAGILCPDGMRPFFLPPSPALSIFKILIYFSSLITSHMRNDVFGSMSVLILCVHPTPSLSDPSLLSDLHPTLCLCCLGFCATLSWTGAVWAWGGGYLLEHGHFASHCIGTEEIDSSLLSHLRYSRKGGASHASSWSVKECWPSYTSLEQVGMAVVCSWVQRPYHVPRTAFHKWAIS